MWDPFVTVLAFLQVYQSPPSSAPWITNFISFAERIDTLMVEPDPVFGTPGVIGRVKRSAL